MISYVLQILVSLFVVVGAAFSWLRLTGRVKQKGK